MDASNEMQKTTSGKHTLTPLLGVVGLVLVLALIGIAIYLFRAEPAQVDDEEKTGRPVYTDEYRKDSVKSLMENASTVVTPIDERERGVQEMLQEAAERNAGVESGDRSIDIPVASETQEERARSIELLKQQDP